MQLQALLDGNQLGSSGVPGVHTKVVYGDPAKAGFYMILLLRLRSNRHALERFQIAEEQVAL